MPRNKRLPLEDLGERAGGMCGAFFATFSTWEEKGTLGMDDDASSAAAVIWIWIFYRMIS